MKTKELEKIKLTKVSVKEDSGEYQSRVLFPEKLAKANETIRRLGIPKGFRR